MQIFYVLRKTARRARRIMGGDLRYRITLLALVLAVLFLLHTAAMVLFEELSWGEAAWLTITTATTVGYGDVSAASSAGRWATVLLMYIGGIFVLAQLAGLIFESAQARLERQRLGKVALNVQDHIVIFGWREDYLRRVVDELRESITSTSEEEIVIVSPSLETLPNDFIRRGVYHVSGLLYDDETLRRANIGEASVLAIIPEGEGDDTVFTNLELVIRLQQQAPNTPIIFAARNRNGKGLAEELGADDALAFDPNYPDIFARAIIAPGAEDVLEEIIGRDGTELVIVHRALSGTIADVISATRGVATLLGIRRANGSYQLNPGHDTPVTSQRLIFLADLARYGSDEVAQETINQALEGLVSTAHVEPFREPRKIGIIGAAGRTSERFMERLAEQLEDQTLVKLGAGVVSAGGKWKAEQIKDMDAVVLLASQPTNPAADARTLLLIRQLREVTNFTGRIIAEAVLPASRERFNKAGADDVLRPVVHNVKILARCIATGAEELLDSLYGSFGDDELIALPVNNEPVWGDYCEKARNIGLPLAFESHQGKVIAPPVDYQLTKGRAFLIVNKRRWRDSKAVRKSLARR